MTLHQNMSNPRDKQNCHRSVSHQANHPKKFIKIAKDIEVKQNDKWAKIAVSYTHLTLPTSDLV